MGLTEQKTDKELAEDFENAASYLEGFRDGSFLAKTQILAEIHNWEKRVSGLGGSNKNAAKSINKIIKNSGL